MKKLNNKGVTLIELIVSFILVAVAVIYFYQTLYTVKKLYSKSQKETQEFVDKTYALRIVDAYIDDEAKVYDSLTNNTLTENICGKYFECDNIKIEDNEDNNIMDKLKKSKDKVF